MPLVVIWPLQWIRDHPFQSGFYIFGIILTIFGNDIRKLIGIQFVSARKAWLQFRYIDLAKTVHTSLSAAKDRDYLNTQLLYCLLLFFGQIGLIILAYSYLVAFQHITSVKNGVVVVVMIFINVNAFSIIVNWVSLTAFYTNRNSSKWYRKKQRKLTDLRSTLEEYGIDISELEKKNEISSNELLRPSLLERIDKGIEQEIDISS